MSEKAPQEQQQITAPQLIEDLQTKGADLEPILDNNKFISTKWQGDNESPEQASLMVDYVDEQPLNAGWASTSHEKDDLHVGYSGDIEPVEPDADIYASDNYEEPRIWRSGTDPKTGERVDYKHTFKNQRKAGQLIASLAAKRIEKTIPPQESGQEHKAA